MLSCLKLMNT